MHFSDLEYTPNHTAFLAPGLTTHQAVSGIGILLFLLSNQKVAFEYLLSKGLSPSNICFQIDHHPASNEDESVESACSPVIMFLLDCDGR
jgi:hypothetical protein